MHWPQSTRYGGKKLFELGEMKVPFQMVAVIIFGLAFGGLLLNLAAEIYDRYFR